MGLREIYHMLFCDGVGHVVTPMWKLCFDTQSVEAIDLQNCGNHFRRFGRNPLAPPPPLHRSMHG